MGVVISLLDRVPKEPPKHPILDALDTLALALTDHGHQWSDEEVAKYETAVAYLTRPSH